MVVFDVQNGRLELPDRNVAVQKDIDLTVRAMLQLGQEEEGDHPADSSGSPHM